MRVFGSYKYDYSGRKRKAKKPKGEVYEKYEAPAFRESTKHCSKVSVSYADQRLAEAKRYRSVSDFSGSNTGGTKTESQKYTGDYVIGIATLHKSNAVPVTNAKYAREISEMIS